MYQKSLFQTTLFLAFSVAIIILSVIGAYSFAIQTTFSTIGAIAYICAIIIWATYLGLMFSFLWDF